MPRRTRQSIVTTAKPVYVATFWTGEARHFFVHHIASPMHHIFLHNKSVVAAMEASKLLVLNNVVLCFLFRIVIEDAHIFLWKIGINFEYPTRYRVPCAGNKYRDLTLETDLTAFERCQICPCLLKLLLATWLLRYFLALFPGLR